VVACNTISATCLPEIEKISPVPVLGVIKPAAQKIIATTKTNHVAVIGTNATINSHAYETELMTLKPDIKITTKSCPLFVPIAEEGLANSDIASLTAHTYLDDLRNTDIDTLHLGCTHYPLLRNTIQKVISEKFQIIDSAEPTAQGLKKILTEKDLLNNNPNPTHKFYFTDLPDRVINSASIFLGQDISSSVQKIKNLTQQFF